MLKPTIRLATLVALAALTAAPAAQADGLFGHGCCQQECCPPVKKVCRPECGTKTVTTWAYSCKCEDYCLPKCNCCMLSKLFHKNCCEPCAPTCDCCTSCDCPRVRKVLYKHPCVHEEPVVKCVPECIVVPQCCPPPCQGGPVYGGPVMAAPAGAVPSQPGELLPPPKIEKK